MFFKSLLKIAVTSISLLSHMHRKHSLIYCNLAFKTNTLYLSLENELHCLLCIFNHIYFPFLTLQNISVSFIFVCYLCKLHNMVQYTLSQ